MRIIIMVNFTAGVRQPLFLLGPSREGRASFAVKETLVSRDFHHFRVNNCPFDWGTRAIHFPPAGAQKPTR